MATTGFDGKLRRPSPSMGMWLLACFAVSLVYWIACSWIVGTNLLATVLLPFNRSKELLAVVIFDIPAAVGLALAFPFGLAEKSITSWLMLIFASGLSTFFGFFVFLLAFANWVR